MPDNLGELLASGLAQAYPGATGEWLSGQLARFTYKPGWTLEIRGGCRLAGPSLRVSYTVPDSRGSGRDVPISGTFPVPVFLTERPEGADAEEFARWLTEILWRAEEHESREWLRRDGHIYDDPHRS